ncbi:MAG: dihydroxyacetone kinase subunit DhaK [Clostridia bacterium]|nr:dihydroxyacetone kinase subunit DhaK [Clostridia bacterium]
MKKMMNRPESFVEETMEAIVLAYGNKLEFLEGDSRILISKASNRDGKVGIVTAGGSGHLPVFLGYVGEGLLDGCAIGNVFASPSASKMEAMIRACDKGAGVLCLYGNYGGDRLNFDMACENVDFDDIKTKTVLVSDDVASSPKGKEEKRRGVAGMVYAFKVAGAAAAMGKSLEEVAAITQEALSNIRTMGIALSPCIVPEVGKPTFSIAEDEMEIGMGIHGEPGIEISTMKTADETAALIMEKIFDDIQLNEGDEVSVMVNGLGATPLEELLIIYRKVHKLLGEKGVGVFMPHIGEFATSMEMAGLSVTIFKLSEKFKDMLKHPASTPFYTNLNK